MNKRKMIPLNHDWFYKEYLGEVDFSTIEDSKFQKVDVPHANHMIPMSYFQASIYQKWSLYKKKIRLDSITNEEVVHIHFEGVMGYCDVYIDQYYIGNHYGGFTAFSFDITKYVKDLNEHFVYVKVDSTERKDFPPYGFVVDYLTYGGIYREVTLEIKPRTYIFNPYLQTKSIQNQEWALSVFFELENESNLEYQIQFEASSDDNQLSYIGKPIKQDDKYLIQVKSTPKVWSLDAPHLYNYTITLMQSNQIIDQINGKFGFREIEVNENGFYLNKEMIKLIGLNRHQSYPYVGYAMPKSVQEQDAIILKNELCVNIVRTSHYPPSRHFLNKCDEIGLLVFEELPGWQHIGDELWKKHAINQLKEMIIYDRNHPSIVIWGVRINESKDDDSFYLETNQLTKRLDPTRPTGGVRNFAKSNLLEDIYTYNDFIHRGYNKGLSKPNHILKHKAPYLITEHNGHMFPTKKYDNESHRIEQAKRHLKVLDDMYANPRIMGAIGWVMNDYHTHHDFGSGDLICHHGVMDMFRIPKFASYAYQSQNSKKPMLQVLSSLSIGEYAAGDPTPIYIMTNCDYIEIFKNNRKIGKYYPDKKQYSNLPHSPIIIDDLIGNLIEQDGQFSKKDANRIKQILVAFRKYGFEMPIKYRIMMGIMMVKYHLDMDKATKLFGTYLGDWGNPAIPYEFKGFINGKEVCNTIKSQVVEARIVIQIDKTQLTLGDTYDATRIIVKCQDQYGNDLIYINNPIKIVVDDIIELIGPSTIPLIGGSTGFWVRTTNHTGLATIEVSNDQFGSHKVIIEVR